ncbi:cytochrome P450 [Plantactinospora sp. B6F1]|uniref:cytochrome P450 n=1 Tax=Plantactinospora sp. B6F1 TaxID=3158971 RepID=UPI00102C95E1
MTDYADPDLFNPFSPEFHADPYPSYARLRTEAPVFRTPFGPWVVSRHADIAEIVRDPRWGHGTRDDVTQALAERGEAVGFDLDLSLQSFLTMDPPDHTRLRGLVNRAFSPRLVSRLEPLIRTVTERLLDDALAAGEVDLIDAYAYPLPLAVICELLGVPVDDQKDFREWSLALARGTEPRMLLSPDVLDRFEWADREFSGYLRELIAARRREPTDDLLGRLVSLAGQGHQLTERELTLTCMLLLVAGHETTAAMIGNATLALLGNPDQLTLARTRPTLTRTAVDELLRYDASVQITRRTALTDGLVVGGQSIHRGESAILLLGAANRDPEMFVDPDRLDLTRESAGNHLSFSAGIHFCLGAALARLELQIAVAALLRRAPALRLAGEVRWRGTLMIRGMDRMPVRLVD